MIITKVYRFYDRRVYPRIRSLRGTTRIGGFLMDMALWAEVRERENHFSLDYRGERLRLKKRTHFQELLDFDPVKGYLKKGSIENGDIVIDAGAFPGEFTIYAAKKVGSEGKVIALEPDEENLEELKHNITLNDLDNVEIVEAGLWNEDKELNLDSKGAGSEVSDEGGMKIEGRTLDSVIDEEQITSVDVVKMDIEGAEIEALKGAENTIKEHTPYVAVASYHVRDGEDTSSRVEKILESYGVCSETGYPVHQTTYGLPEESGRK